MNFLKKLFRKGMIVDGRIFLKKNSFYSQFFLNRSKVFHEDYQDRVFTTFDDNFA
jgi:hypothetical protein